jgi:glycosyltransferase involved in cell wall biosynthesis
MSPVNQLISVCICTFKRPELFEKLLVELEKQNTNGEFEFEVVVVDNDPMQSGKPVFQRIKNESKLSISYYHEPERSISLARNKCITLANGNFIAFIDDDEFPSEKWLQLLFYTMIRESADGVLGPVEPFYDNETPKWLKKSNLLNRDRLKTGEIIRHPKYTRTGNVIFKRDIFDDIKVPFDPKYGKIGGGDVEFFERMLVRKKRFAWCNEAVVYEHIEAKRRKRAYYIKRAFTRGLTNSMKYPFLSIGTLKSLVAIPFYLLVVPFSFFLGQHTLIKYAVKICDHIGKILGYLRVKIVKERPY